MARPVYRSEAASGDRGDVDVIGDAQFFDCHVIGERDRTCRTVTPRVSKATADANIHGQFPPAARPTAGAATDGVIAGAVSFRSAMPLGVGAGVVPGKGNGNCG